MASLWFIECHKILDTHSGTNVYWWNFPYTCADFMRSGNNHVSQPCSFVTKSLRISSVTFLDLVHANPRVAIINHFLLIWIIVASDSFLMQ